MRESKELPVSEKILSRRERFIQNPLDKTRHLRYDSHRCKGIQLYMPHKGGAAMKNQAYRMAMLYDFYGELLTEKQKAVITQHFLNDLSLNEVAIEHNITRQAVLDMIRRTEKLLLQYEDKLQLVKKYLVRKEKVSDVLKRLDALGNDEKIEDIKSLVSQILD